MLSTDLCWNRAIHFSTTFLIYQPNMLIDASWFPVPFFNNRSCLSFMSLRCTMDRLPMSQLCNEGPTPSAVSALRWPWRPFGFFLSFPCPPFNRRAREVPRSRRGENRRGVYRGVLRGRRRENRRGVAEGTAEDPGPFVSYRLVGSVGCALHSRKPLHSRRRSSTLSGLALGS